MTQEKAEYLESMRNQLGLNKEQGDKVLKEVRTEVRREEEIQGGGGGRGEGGSCGSRGNRKVMGGIKGLEQEQGDEVLKGPAPYVTASLSCPLPPPALTPQALVDLPS